VGMVADLRNPGGWPLRVALPGADGVAPEFKRFGLPPLPIIMQWSLKKNPVHYVSFESFRLNTGKLPQLVMVQLRKFLTFDPMNQVRDTHTVADSACCVADSAFFLSQDIDATDSIMLRHPELATPFCITMRYYGEQANPLENLATAGCMQEWWSAIREHITHLRSTNAITPMAAMGMFVRYMSSCIESHRGMILSGSYRSTRIQQALQIVDGIPMSPLADVKLKPIVERMANRVPDSIRHDTYLRASCLFMYLFEDINSDFVLNSGNLECAIEMLISSLGWLVGSHNATFKWFFQVQRPCRLPCVLRYHLTPSSKKTHRGYRSSLATDTFASQTRTLSSST